LFSTSSEKSNTAVNTAVHTGILTHGITQGITDMDNSNQEDQYDPYNSLSGANDMDGLNSDRVNINLGGGEGGGGGGMGAAALVAALGGRNQGGDNAALVAALNNRGGGYGDGFGFGGGGALWPLLLLGGGLGFGGRRDRDCCDDNDGALAILGKLGSIEGAVPLAAANIQNAILESTSTITGQVNQVGLAQLAATSGVRDSVQNGTAALLQAGSANTQSILTAICGLSSKLDHNQIADLQRQLAVAQLASTEDRLRHHSDGVEVRVSQNVTQVQAQAQQQQQFAGLFDRLERRLHSIEIEQNQIAKNTNANLIIGSTGVATGAQSANPVNVR
jgi:hypothetical protein